MPPLELPQSVSDLSLPPSAHALLLGGVLVGVVLWLFGRRILRVGFVLAGGVAGAIVAYFAAPALGVGADPVIAAGAGALAGALLGGLVFRVSVAAAAGSLAGAMAVAGAVALAPQTQSDLRSAADAPVDWSGLIGPSLEWKFEPEPFDLGVFNAEPAARNPDPAEQVRAFVDSLAEELRPRWNELPTTTRMRITSAGVVGFLLGLASGLFWPKRAAAAISGFLGPAIFLPSAAVMLASPEAPESLASVRASLSSPLIWLGAWFALGVVGTAVQWTRRRPEADKT